MANSLTQKERMLLKDQISHEKICIQKYNNYANQTQDPQLKQLLQTYARQEEQHLNTLNQILSGTVPNLQQQGQQQQQQGQQQQQQRGQQLQQQAGAGGMPRAAGAQTGMTGQNDQDLCNDLLMTEKYVSNTYDTAIFEFTDSNIRQVLNHIQKEEQQHGEGIFNYMQSHGMYNPQ
ncbi:MAG TPA: spore coat protein [Firmicutes bacterium]|nr:spore coat protein [Bacillota bacterium]